MTRSRPSLRAIVLVLAAAAGLVAWAWAPHRATAESQSGLQSTIDSSKAQEQQLKGALARIAALEQRTARSVAILQGRLNSAQTQLDRAQAREAQTLSRLEFERTRAARLAARLTQVRNRLAQALRNEYENPPPDLVTVIFEARGFADLLDTVDYLRRVQRSDAQIATLVGRARNDARRQRRTLGALQRRQQAAAMALQTRRNALSQIAAGLAQRQAALAQAQAARQDALSATHARRLRAQKLLTRLVSEQEKAAVTNIGPGGPWAIPWAVVQCESGGQNLPPNYATASGYYQMIDSTWHGLGGTTPHAYQASKAQQDRLAAKLWDGGRGASNWVCAYIVGIV